MNQGKTPYYTQTFGAEPKPYTEEALIELGFTQPGTHHVLLNHAAFLLMISGSDSIMLVNEHETLVAGYVGQFEVALSKVYVFTDAYQGDALRSLSKAFDVPMFVVIPAEHRVSL